jgi:restriction endonuclease S subunit
MQFSVISYSNVPVFDKRLDPEFYEPKNIKLERQLQKTNSIPLGELCNLHDGPFGSELLSSSYSENGVPALRMQNVTKYGLPKLDNVEFILEHEADRLIKHIAYAGEVVTTKIGFLGYSTVLASAYDRYFFRRELTRLVIKDGVNLVPDYLATFLNTNYGRMQALRYSTGTTRDRVLLVNQRHMLVPIFSNNFQSLIAKSVVEAQRFIEKFGTTHKDAENILLSELGLTNWQPKHQLTFVKNYSDTEQAGRIDAEYYQPKYEEIVKAIQNYSGGWDTLGKIVTLKDKNFNPHDKKQYKYIELANIAGNGEITDCMIEEGQNLPTRARRKVVTGDVIVSSIEGSLSSIALIENEYDQSLCSTGFHVINSNDVNSETLMVFLKSMVGQLQLKKCCSGTILTAINQDEFGRVVLPRVEKSKQTQIQQKVTESFNLRNQSKHLLECSKRAVEMAIEQDEQKAINWLKEQTRDIGVMDAD